MSTCSGGGWQTGIIICITRLGTRKHFEFMVIIKDNTINEIVVTTGRSISKQRPWAIYSVFVACIVRQEIEVTPLTKKRPN